MRTYRRDDLPLSAGLNADPEVMRYLGGVALNRRESDEIAKWAQALYGREGIGETFDAVIYAIEAGQWLRRRR